MNIPVAFGFGAREGLGSCSLIASFAGLTISLPRPGQHRGWGVHSQV